MEFDPFHVPLQKISCGSNEALDPDVTKKQKNLCILRKPDW